MVAAGHQVPGRGVESLPVVLIIRVVEVRKAKDMAKFMTECADTLKVCTCVSPKLGRTCVCADTDTVIKSIGINAPCMRPDSVCSAAVGLSVTRKKHIDAVHVPVIVQVVDGEIHFVVQLRNGLPYHGPRHLIVLIVIVSFGPLVMLS